MTNEELISLSLQRLDALIADEPPHYVLRFTWQILRDVGFVYCLS